MYKCKNCRTIFKEPKSYLEENNEKWDCCPFCHDTNFVEMKRPKDIEPLEVLEMLVYLCASYNTRNKSAIEYAVDRVRRFISETVNDEDLYTDLKSCKTVNSTQQIINFIYENFKEKE